MRGCSFRSTLGKWEEFKDERKNGICAFWGCDSLSQVTIPESVTEIGTQVFEECSRKLTICRKKGSYAEQYAKNNAIPFREI